MTSSFNNSLQSMTLDQLQQAYNDITKAIQVYQDQERVLWNEIVTSQDPNFVQNQRAYQNQQKLEKLQTEREEIMSSMVERYNQNTSGHASALKIQANQQLLDALQKDIYHQNDSRLAHINSDILTTERVSMIAKDQYDQLFNANQIINLTNIFVALFCIVLGMGLLVKHSIVMHMIVMVSFIILLILYIISLVAKIISNRKITFNYASPNLTSPYSAFHVETGMNSSSKNCPSFLSYFES